MAVRLCFRAPVLCAAAVLAALVVTPVVTPAGGFATAHAADAVPAPPDVDVASYVVADYDTGQILAERSPHRALYPASTLKVLTADTLLPRLSPSMAVTPKASDFAAEPDGSVVGMTAGVTYTVADLWRATFLDSANDAVAELAHLAGGLDTTVALMQKKARSLGANDTVVADADGYDADGQVTSAYDLAVLARAGLDNASFRAYCGLRQAAFPGPDGTSIALKSHDPMLLSYPGMIGIKGGITTKAGHTYVGAAVRDGHTVIETLMLGGTDIFDQAALLMDWGLAADGHVSAVGSLGAPKAGTSAPSASGSSGSSASASKPTSAATVPTSPSGTSPSGSTGPAQSPAAGGRQPSGTSAAGTPLPPGATITLAGEVGGAPTRSASSPPSRSIRGYLSGSRATTVAVVDIVTPDSDPVAPNAVWLGLLAAGGVGAIPLSVLIVGRRRARG
ncbi:MAG: D-alanyl-D-alanine carboxypeptidase [Catenulispora sp.]|nr:D-alanyl-D-alanine carboxypeptidase [Catenulispora sp.]